MRCCIILLYVLRMPRKARIDAPGALQHIIGRGIERRNIFIDDADKDNFVARLGHIGYHGTYWWIPGFVAAGDQARFAAAMAPRPLMLWAPTDDVGMPKDAVEAFVDAVSPAYSRAGAPGAFVVHQPPGEHAFSLQAFEAMDRFFARHLGARPPTPQSAPGGAGRAR